MKEGRRPGNACSAPTPTPTSSLPRDTPAVAANAPVALTLLAGAGVAAALAPPGTTFPLTAAPLRPTTAQDTVDVPSAHKKSAAAVTPGMRSPLCGVTSELRRVPAATAAESIDPIGVPSNGSVVPATAGRVAATEMLAAATTPVLPPLVVVVPTVLAARGAAAAEGAAAALGGGL